MKKIKYVWNKHGTLQVGKVPVNCKHVIFFVGAVSHDPSQLYSHAQFKKIIKYINLSWI